MEEVVATHVSGSKVRIALYGASLISFVSADGNENLFLSKKAITDGTKPIRGGVPLVFPQFGAGKLTNHGFARTSMWKVSQDATTVTIDKEEWTELSLSLSPNEDIKSQWPHPFNMTYSVRFSANKLSTSLKIENTGDEAFEFQALLHTYYKIDAIENIQIHGLGNFPHIDQLQNRMVIEPTKDDSQSIGQEVDRIYTSLSSADSIVISSESKSTKLTVSLLEESSSVPHDVVLWNPWIDKSKRMDDFDDEEYHEMLCVEPGCVSDFKTCKVGSHWTLSQIIEFSQDSKKKCVE